MQLAILSDTHGLLRPEVAEHLKTADAILHGGDINRQSIVDELRQYAPLYIVRGNNDKDWAEAIPHDLTVTLGGVTFFMVHNKKEVPADLAGVDAVFDCVYNPSETLLLGRARAYGKKTAGGMAMLVWQAAIAHERWHGTHFQEADIARIITDMERALTEKERGL